MNKVSKHLIHYFPLVLIFGTGLICFILFSYNKVFEVVIAISMAILYVLWGIIHHAIHKDLYLEIVIEYLLFAAIGLLLVLSLLF